VPPAAGAAFLDTMEAYFRQPRGVKLADARPDLCYQVGVTPDGVETPRDVAPWVATLPDAGHHPAAGAPAGRPAADPKWRFLHRIGPRPPADAPTAYPELNAAPVTPAAPHLAPVWGGVLTSWGAPLLRTVETVAAMLAVGLGHEAGALTHLMALGPHLLAPTGVDLDGADAPDAVGTVLAGAHYDLNLLTIHGGARFPGLCLWDRAGRRLAVRVPPGCLLVQAGRQVEHLTGGRVRRGMHEVVVTPATVAAVGAAKAAAAAAAAARGGREGGPAPRVWRVSSTLFAHVASDRVVAPLGGILADGAGPYPPMPAGEMVAEELRAIKLAAA